MAASSQVSQNKRGRYEYLSGRLDLPETKRPNSGTLGYDSDLMALLDKIDSMDNYNSTISENTYSAVNEVEGKLRVNGTIKSLQDEIGSEAQKENNNIESSDEGSSTEQMGSNKQNEFPADGNSEATSVTFDIADFTYYTDVGGDVCFFIDHFSPYELGIPQNHIDGDSIPDIIYSDAMHDFVDTTEVFYGSLWEDDIWQFNEHPAIQNDFASPQPKEFGSSGADLSSPSHL